MKDKLVMLIILDGYGINPRKEGNAIEAANKPNIDRFMREYPNTIVRTSGMDVGLPDGQMGNSEVGHTNIGAGRIVYQELTRITKSIQDGDFFEKKEFLDAAENCRKHNSSCISSDFFLTAACTATIPTCMVSWSLQKGRIERCVCSLLL